MISLNARIRAKLRSSFLSALLVLFMFAAYVLPSFAEERIFISDINPSSAYPNDTVRVYGSGGRPNATVFAMLAGPMNEDFIVKNDSGPWVVLGLGNLTVGSAFIGESGTWEISFLTPNVYPGRYDVYVFDNGSLTSDAVSLDVLMNVMVMPLGPGLTVTYAPFNITFWTSNMTGQPLLFFVAGNALPSSGPPGTIVTVLGRFASDGDVNVYFDDFQVAAVIGQPSGDWSASFQVPIIVSVGNHTIRAIDVGGRWMSIASFYVTSSIVSFSMSSLSLFGLFAVAVFSGVVLFMLLVTFSKKRK